MAAITTYLVTRSKKILERLNKRYRSNKSPGEESSRLFKLGEKYFFGKGRTRKEERRAAEYFKLSAELGNHQARAVLGFCYEFGLGVRRDFKLAEANYIKSAEYGDGLVQARLAFLQTRKGFA
ncbi:hypothetical protein K7432_016741 [Basidiobolus ranarum]|uniref:Uncharacterized protein n=1 Tax=Basidiobolus ranarum TaxID=34480 RepID=A0ABR2WEA4_9FUNG